MVIFIDFNFFLFIKNKFVFLKYQNINNVLSSFFRHGKNRVSLSAQSGESQIFSQILFQSQCNFYFMARNETH